VEGTHPYLYGAEIPCAVTNSSVTEGLTQYVCRGWTLTGTADTNGFTRGTGTSLMVVHTNLSVLTWLWQTNYWLDVDAGANGTITPEDGWFPAGSSVTVTARADTYYHFVTWTGAIHSAGNPESVSIDAPRFVGAVFAEDRAMNNTPHWWLASHGLTNRAWDLEAVDDQDGDGALTWQEYVADTVPTNASSVLAVTGIRPDGSSVVVEWEGGNAARQFLESRFDLVLTTDVWAAVFTNEPPTPRETNFLDSSSAPGPRYYRVRAQR
jgi:hypothetical protein